jgi:ABC-type multidrug transport system fused ATPase/permease subunit
MCASQSFLFAWSGESLTKRLRAKVFRALLRQEMAYFDDPRNNTGSLCARLATEASAVQGATGTRLGMILENIASLGTGILICFAFSWQLTLLVLAFVPLMALGGFLHSRMTSGFGGHDQALIEETGKVPRPIGKKSDGLYHCLLSSGDDGINSKHSHSGTTVERRVFLQPLLFAHRNSSPVKSMLLRGGSSS